MPFSSAEDRRAYQAAYLWNRRASWIRVNGPCKGCGSKEGLEVFQTENGATTANRVWSYTKQKRDVTLHTCIVLCHDCRSRRSADKARAYPEMLHGTLHAYKHYACRCDFCRRANSTRTTLQKQRKRALVRRRCLPNAAPTHQREAAGHE